MDALYKKIDFIANVAIIVVATLVCVVLVKSYVLPEPAGDAVEEGAGGRKLVKRGDAVSLSGVDWGGNGKTLLLVLSTTCHFCTQDGPFYQRLTLERGGTRLIALVPQAADAGRNYLKDLGVIIDDVRQVSIAELGVSGTPTLILVDGTGTVADVWVGALSPNQEKDVISRL